jgi:hypothetical protein
VSYTAVPHEDHPSQKQPLLDRLDNTYDFYYFPVGTDRPFDNYWDFVRDTYQLSKAPKTEDQVGYLQLLNTNLKLLNLLQGQQAFNPANTSDKKYQTALMQLVFVNTYQTLKKIYPETVDKAQILAILKKDPGVKNQLGKYFTDADSENLVLAPFFKDPKKDPMEFKPNAKELIEASSLDSHAKSILLHSLRQTYPGKLQELLKKLSNPDLTPEDVVSAMPDLTPTEIRRAIYAIKAEYQNLLTTPELTATCLATWRGIAELDQTTPTNPNLPYQQLLNILDMSSGKGPSNLRELGSTAAQKISEINLPPAQ